MKQSLEILKDSKNNTIFTIIFMVLLAIAILPVFIYGLYSIPEGDDFNYFWHLVEERDKGNGYLKSAYNVMLFFYKNWSGAYSFNFLTAFLCPYVRWGLVGFSITCFLCGLLLIFSISVFISTLFKKFFLRNEYLLFAIVSIIFLWVFMFDLSEILYWFATICAYSIPLSLMLLGYSILINADNNFVMFISCLFLFTAVGGNLQIVGIVVGIYICLVMYHKLSKKKSFVITVPILIGILINVLASGNYTRAKYIHPEGMSIFYCLTSMITMIKCIIRLFGRIAISPLQWVLLITAVIVGRNIKEPRNILFIHILKMFLIGMVILGGSIFPAILGVASLSPRHLAIAGLIAVCFSFLMIVVLYGFLKKFLNRKIIGCFVLCLIIINIVLYSSGRTKWYVSNNMISRAYKDIYTGKLKDNYDQWKYIFNCIEESSEESVDVVVHGKYQKQVMVHVPIAYFMETWMVSPNFVKYTGKKKVSIIWDTNEEKYKFEVSLE